MPTSEEICRAEQKYMPFFGTERVTERAFRKNSITWEHIQNDATLRSGFFSAKRAR